MLADKHPVVCSLLTILLAWPVSTATAQAQNPSPPPPESQVSQNLKQLSIEELSELTITTAARRPERLAQTPAAISMIRQEDIRRSGASTLAEAMRLADATDAARVYGPGWAISTRGFTIATANKMLVLIDGRTVYSPLFSGVFWEVQDLMLADVDRIEVIRGPGGALWGANAVNGVINIITKRAADTRGALVDVTAGSETRADLNARYGGRLGGEGSYRVYGKFRADDAHTFATGASGLDDYDIGQTGFRLESSDEGAASWLVEGDAYKSSAGLYDRPDTRLSGGNVLGRWTRRFSSTSEFQAQVYYDRTYRRVQRQFKATRDTFDIDTQQQLQIGSRQRVVAGAGFRASGGDDLGDGPGFFFDPQIRTSTIASVFGQDEIAIRPDRLFVTLGTKLERNDFTGFEIQPTARVRWSPNLRQTAWAAVSRAVRMPTRFDTDLRIVVPGTSILFLTGNPDFKSETVIAYEGGYRTQIAERASVDFAAFANRYDDLRSQEPPLAPGQPIVLANTLNARTSGAELSATVSPTKSWQLHGSYSYLWKRFTRDPASRDPTGGASEANDPAHLFSIRSYLDLPREVQFDAFLRFVSARPQPAVDSYTEANVRLGRRIRGTWDLSLIGSDLLHPHHIEFAAGTPLERFDRAVSVRSTWRF